MTDDELTALIGPPAPDRVRVVMKRRGTPPPRVHPDHRAFLAAPPPDEASAWPPRRPPLQWVSVAASMCGLTVGLLIVLAATVVLT